MTYKKQIEEIAFKEFDTEFWGIFKNFKYPFLYVGCTCSDQQCSIDVIKLDIKCKDEERAKMLKRYTWILFLHKLSRYIKHIGKLLKRWLKYL